MANQIKIEPHVLIVSRTNRQGIIEYANRDFSAVSGYAMEELIDRPHRIIRHPDMPGVIFKMMPTASQSTTVEGGRELLLKTMEPARGFEPRTC